MSTRTPYEDPAYPSDPGLIAPSSGHSPFARLPLPAAFHSSSAFGTASTSNTSSPYVTDQPRSALNRTFGGRDYVPPDRAALSPADAASGASGGAGGAGGAAAPQQQQQQQQGEPRGQTLEEMYSAPENTLEIEVRDPQTRGASTPPS